MCIRDRDIIRQAVQQFATGVTATAFDDATKVTCTYFDNTLAPTAHNFDFTGINLN